ncbi:helix-turn-helix transcriptional regulator [Actinomadura kijaniata]|uniref:Transcriptional regulator with XRE-family HTH domain n=1 Tax=Actinomadura namibiensis TaxID=182080 RepID=A0A7W3LIT6_ACTNM|nr:helix-turn-helix transcriptional regulator [Actinomadura namibiensis]MBA8948827.1 transcriptional regulator with XRE-family HTH domain [Actinomadura namibiensis]
MATRQPTPQTKAFGQEVSRLREEAGITRSELASRVPISTSYVSQIERGVTRCRRDMAERLDAALGTTPALAEAWNQTLKRAAYPKFFQDYPEAEATASLLRAWVENFVLGLFQTEAYIRAQGVSEDVFDGRLRRQRTVLERENPPTIAVVLSETVLLRSVGGPQVMKAQCERLMEVSGLPNVILQVAPIAYYRGVSGSFVLATQQDGRDLLYLETTPGGVISNDPAEILHVQKVFPTLSARALDPESSRRHIEKVISERWT